MHVDTIVFDVIGTVVDEASIAEDLASVGVAADVGRRWAEAMDRRLGEIRAGRAEWRSSEDVRRDALHEVLPDAARLDPDRLAWLEDAGGRLRPWPDSPAALRALGEHFMLVALSNASLAELAEISARGGLAWHAVLSGALVKAYKPSPAVYELAIGSLGLDPSRTLMVAAHAWDLRAAASHGLRTAFVARPGADHPREDDRFDLSVDDLGALGLRLLDGQGQASPGV
jgi:2-haloacid dehalogenase